MDKIPLIQFAPVEDFHKCQLDTTESLAARVALESPDFHTMAHDRQIELVKAALHLAFATGACAALKTVPPESAKTPSAPLPMPTAGHA